MRYLLVLLLAGCGAPMTPQDQRELDMALARCRMQLAAIPTGYIPSGRGPAGPYAQAGAIQNNQQAARQFMDDCMLTQGYSK